MEQIVRAQHVAPVRGHSGFGRAGMIAGPWFLRLLAVQGCVGRRGLPLIFRYVVLHGSKQSAAAPKRFRRIASQMRSPPKPLTREMIELILCTQQLNIQ